LLSAGGAVALAGAFCPPYKQWYSPLPDALRIIAAHPIGWRCIHAGFFAGTVIAALGFAVLARASETESQRTLATVAAAAFGFATIFWSCNIAFRVSLTPWAANEFVSTGTIPAMYAPLERYVSILFGAFVALAAVALACTGGLVLRSGIAPRWVGWTALGVGVIGAPMVGMIGPWVLYVPVVMLGVSMLLR
jgi:hypothetical protein